ncbi:MAG: PAS domain S-box protein [Methanoregula sp.]|nr:PAS domain S-box protein [Methanoregula sp.]
MNEHSEETPDWEAQRNRIIGLGETSIRKSYYPELQQRILELEKKNRELAAAYAEQTAVDEELRQQIDETAKKEQELRESEESLTSIIENIPLMLFVKDAMDLRFVRFNKAGEELLGYPREDLIGKNDQDFFPKEQADFFTEKDRHVLGSKTLVDIPEETIGTRTHGERILHTRKIPIISSNGEPRFLLGISEDITEWKHREHILKTQRDLGIALQNSPRLEEMLGICLSAGTEIAKMDSGGIYLVDPTSGSLDLAVSRNLGEEFLKLISHYPADSDNARLVMQGKPIYVPYSKTGIIHTPVQEQEGLLAAGIIPISFGGRVIASLNVTSHTLDEISLSSRIALETISAQIGAAIEQKMAEVALRESEGRFAAFMDHLPITAFIKDEQSTNLFVNRHMAEVFGAQEWIGKSVGELFPDEAAEKMIEDDRQTLRDGYRKTIENLVEKNGEPKIFETYKFRIDRDNKSPLIGGFAMDITERKRGEDALRESEKKYRNIVETTPDLIWEIDIQGNFTYLSPQIFDLFGYRAEDLMGKPFFILIPQDQIPAIKMAFERQVAGASAIVTLEVIARHADGRLMDMEIRSASATDEQDRLRGFRGVTRDITERKRAEERIRASEEMFRSLIRESADGISLMDERGTVIEWNDAMVKISGIPREEAVGAQQADVMVSMMIPEHRTPDRIERFRKAISEAQQTGESVYFSRPIEAGILRRDGNRRQIHQIAYPIRTPKGYRIGSIARDITESKSAQDALRISEERYRSLVDITDTGYLVLDNRGLITDANDVYLRLTGRSSLDELTGHSVTEWTAPYDLERNAREVEKCLTTGQVRGLEIDYVKPDGTIQPVEINAAVFNAGSGDVILTLCRDISERKRTNVALQQARNKLNLLNAVTFQDIQTAAFSLSAYQELVKTVLVDAKARSYVDKQELFLKKMVDTLAFARNYQEMGMHPSRWQNVQQVFLYAISHLDFLHMKQNLQLENLEIFADPLFEKALFNIMENVLSHGVRATEVTLRYEEKTDHLTLIIGDNGVGIPPEEKNMIFDRGYGKGSGLGLFLVREVLSITGMTIKESGTSGQGTRFEITVPHGVYRFNR